MEDIRIEKSVSQHGEDSLIQSVQRIEKALTELNTKIPPPVPLWRNWKFYLVIAGLLLLFFVDFPQESRRKADLVVLEGTSVGVELHDRPDIIARPEFLRPNSAGPCRIVDTELFITGLRYEHSAIGIQREKSGTYKASFLGGPLQITRDTVIRFRPLSDVSDETDREVYDGVVRFCDLIIGKNRYPVFDIVDASSRTGKLTIATVPPVGWRRFKSNLEIAFGLVF